MTPEAVPVLVRKRFLFDGAKVAKRTTLLVAPQVAEHLIAAKKVAPINGPSSHD